MIIHTAFDDFDFMTEEEELEENDCRQAVWIADEMFIEEMLEQDSLFSTCPKED